MSALGVTPRLCATVCAPVAAGLEKVPTLKTACACAGRGAHARATMASVTTVRIGVFIWSSPRDARRGGSRENRAVPRAVAFEIDVLEPVLHGSGVLRHGGVCPCVAPSAARHAAAYADQRR